MSRALAHVETISKVDDLPGYDRVGSAHILGWRVIVRKEELHAGDKVVYFEIDSLLPKDDERFAFMDGKKYKVKTQKMCKSISQGLAMPLSEFPELGDPDEGTDVTKKLGIKYYVPEDNKRKSNRSVNKDAKYGNMLSRMKKNNLDLYNSKIVVKLRRSNFGKKILYLFFGNNKYDVPRAWPSYIEKSDEVRIENCPFILEDRDSRFSMSEKLDGCSTSIGVEKKGLFGKYELSVCSRNVCFSNYIENQETYFEENYYQKMEKKYDAYNKLVQYAKEVNAKTVYIQGECVGPKIQGNPYKLDDHDLYVYQIVVDGQKMSHQDIVDWCEDWGFKSVPVIMLNHQLPDNMEEMKAEAAGRSALNMDVAREGIVYKHMDDPDLSFKNVSNSYLLKHS